MGARIDPAERFKPLHTDLPYKRDDGYTIRFTKDDIGKLFTVKYQYTATHDHDVGDAYRIFDCNLIGKLFGNSQVGVVACTKDKDPQAVQDPPIAKQDLQDVGSWSLAGGAGHVTQRFNALEQGTADGKRFLLVFGIRVLASDDAGRVKLKTLKYTTG